MKDCCTKNHDLIKQKLVNSQEYMQNVEEVSKIFSLLGDATRMKILLALMEGELCVYHICEIVGGKQSAISQHLRKLKDYKIVKSKKLANQVLYSIADEHVSAIIRLGLEHKGCI